MNMPILRIKDKYDRIIPIPAIAGASEPYQVITKSDRDMEQTIMQFNNGIQFAYGRMFFYHNPIYLYGNGEIGVGGFILSKITFDCGNRLFAYSFKSIDSYFLKYEDDSQITAISTSGSIDTNRFTSIAVFTLLNRPVGNIDGAVHFFVAGRWK